MCYKGTQLCGLESAMEMEVRGKFEANSKEFLSKWFIRNKEV